MSRHNDIEDSAEIEPVIEPDLEIVDAHHHIMDHFGFHYALADLQRDLDDGHRIVGTVYVESGMAFRTEGPDHLRAVGEVAFAHELQAQARDSAAAVAAAIVSQADLTQGERAAELLDAQIAAGGGKMRGVRQHAARDASAEIPSPYSLSGPELYEREDFCGGAAALMARDLSFDSWQYFPQLPALAAFAGDFPDLRIVVNHCGGILGVGSYAGQREEIFALWRSHITALAQYPNVWMKIGGLGMHLTGFEEIGLASSSEAIAQVYRPYVEHCVEKFGPARCMFESNFPVDRHMSSYRALWNVFKRIAAGCSADEKALLFRDTAMRFYRI